MENIGAQLYTVRDYLTNEKIESTFKTIKEIGYDSVQLFGSCELIENCAKSADEAGLLIVGILADLNTCEEYGEKIFEMCKKYNIPDIGVSSNFEECQDVTNYINRINDFSHKAVTAGFTFSYHNHGHEFIKLADGKTPMEHFIDGFNPNTVDFMPDTYWIHDGGYDIRRFLEQTKNRVKILHLKDAKRTLQGLNFAEIGNGKLYFEGIIKTARDCGIKHFVVEQDVCDGDPIESLKQSYNYLNKLRVK